MKQQYALPAMLVAVASPSMATTDPGRCEGDHSRIQAPAFAKPYLECLSGADEKYGFNNGPYAVSRCAQERTGILSKVPKNGRQQAKAIFEDLDRSFVWSVWCGTDAGRELQTNIPIRADWPQNANAVEPMTKEHRP